MSRYNGGSFTDNDSQLFYIFGGMAASGPLNDLWKFDLKYLRWNKLSMTGEIPSPRFRFS